MSYSQHTKAVLPGYEGPFFPVALRDLNQAQEEKGIANGVELDRLGATIDGFIETIRPTTSDGYSWFWGMRIRSGKNEVIILFPWAQDWGQRDGTQKDRSHAVHTKGTFTPKMLETIIQQVTRAMQTLPEPTS